MGLHIINDLPTERNVQRRYPVTQEHRIDENREAIKAVLAGVHNRILLIIGPCSAWPFEAVEEYSHRLARMREKVEERLLLVLRTYIQKPRTTVGWPGPLNQPDPLNGVDIEDGIWKCREMMCKAAMLHPLADEMLFTHNAPHFDPLLSYTALGARSAEDMEHRYIASGLDSAVGVKNGTGGDLPVGVNGVMSVQHPHTFALHNQQVRTDGNPFAHLVLRGGGGKTNYDGESIVQAMQLLREARVKNPAIVVDASHDNSLHENGNGKTKDPHQQAQVIDAVMQGMLEARDGYEGVKGFMVESFLKTGNQKISPTMDRDGLSITDPCLGWQETEQLIRKMADAVDAMR